MQLSEYEERVLKAINERKAKRVKTAPRRIIPESVKSTGRRASAKINEIPGAERARASAANAYVVALRGVGRALGRVGGITLSQQRVLDAYSKRDQAVESLDDIHRLDLRAVESVRPTRMDVVYASVAGLEGAAAGAVITGGEALATAGTVFGMGVASAPGFGTVMTAMATDAAFTLSCASRAVAHTALYYGYDPEAPEEQVYMLAVINLASSVTSGAKVVGYRELSVLTQLLARRAPWAKLLEQALPRIAQQFALRFGVRLTQRKLGQLVPVVGIGLGFGMNYKLLDDVVEEAYWIYRERFILDKLAASGEAPFPVSVPEVPEEPDETSAAGEPEAELSVIQLLTESGLQIEPPSERPHQT